MRRGDREMDHEFGLSVIDKAEYVVVSMVDSDGNPYGVPMSVARVEDKVYMHAARTGRKVDCLEKNSQVHLTFVGEVKRAEPFGDEAFMAARQSGKIGEMISKIFTTEFESAMVWGKAEFVEDDQEKIVALRALSEKYVAASMDHFDMAMVESLKVTSVIRVSLADMSAKRKKYDKSGQEMKWGRME
jgi:hypothetical protein